MKTRRTRTRQMVAVSVATAAALIFLSVAAGVANGDGPWVYIAELDAWVEQSDEPGVREAQPDLTITSGGSALVPETPNEPRPAPVPARIQTVQTAENKSDTTALVPFAAAEFDVTNVYTVGDGSVETSIWAGSYPDDPNRGALIKMTQSWDTGVDTTEVVEPTEPHGALTLTGFTSTTVSFRAADNWTGAYNPSTGAITMQEPNGPCPPWCPPPP